MPQTATPRGYLNIEPKYMLNYAVEAAFRADTRRLPNGQQLKLLLNVALNVRESLFWKGFSRGHHREVELIHPVPLPAKPSGPKRPPSDHGHERTVAQVERSPVTRAREKAARTCGAAHAAWTG